MSRKTARDNAFKIIFEAPFHNNNVDAVLDTFLSLGYDNDLSKKDMEYINTTTKGVFEKLNDIDDKLNNSLKGWTIDRLPKTTGAILRLAAFEIEYLEDVPYQVAINEAIELSKIYCDDDAPKFINGVLDTLKGEK